MPDIYLEFEILDITHRIILNLRERKSISSYIENKFLQFIQVHIFTFEVTLHINLSIATAERY